MSATSSLPVQSGIDHLGILPSVVNEMRNQACYLNVPAASLPPQLAVSRDQAAPNVRRIRGRLDNVEVAGIGYLTPAGDVFKSLVVAFSAAH